MKKKEQDGLRLLIKTREDAQSMRKTISNRLGLKADGDAIKGEGATIALSLHTTLNDSLNNAKQIEKDLEKELRRQLKKMPVYTEFLKDVKGAGEVGCGWVVGEFDIETATTVSKMWQYSGMNGSLVKGKKRISKSKYKPSMGSIVREMKNIRTGETDYIIQTNEMIRGDKATPGFVLPYNKNLKTHLLGVMAAGFVKAQNDYCMNFYYPYKHRLENSTQLTTEVKKGGKREKLMWKDCTKGHRNMAALRYMMKMFLKDLYINWRSIEGLTVREPYSEEYLGKKHAG